jgi:hypothetical protein
VTTGTELSTMTEDATSLAADLVLAIEHLWGRVQQFTLCLFDQKDLEGMRVYRHAGVSYSIQTSWPLGRRIKKY